MVMIMPINAYVLLKLRPIPVNELSDALKKYPAIKSCSIVTGEIDAILYVEVEDTKELFELVKDIRDLPFILETRTSIIISQC